MANRTHSIKKTLRLTPKQAELLAARANEAGTNETDYLRLLLEQKPGDSAEVKALAKELINETRRVGNNINQIARNRNLGKRHPNAPLHGFQLKHYDKLCHTAKLGKGSYSYAWKHRKDIMKMKALERQHLFIVRHDIRSEGELDGKIAEIAERKKAASAEKGRAYRKARKCQDLFDTAHAMTRLEPMRIEYERGDGFFRNEYERWSGLNQQLITAGYTLPQALELEKRCKERKSSLARAERELCLELKTGMEIKEGLVAERTKAYAEERVESVSNERDRKTVELYMK
jgi:hypothetical protein